MFSRFLPCFLSPRSSRDVGQSEIQDRLNRRIETMKEILDITRQPGMSIGVIHHGQEAFKYNYGLRDIENRTNSDTLYCIASLSKAFMAASLDLLVQRGEFSWDDIIESIIPEFKHVDKPNDFSSTTVRDICSHRTGLLSLDEITQGLDARILIHKKDVVKVCNALPVKHDLRTSYLYNNALYELAGHIVERKSGYANWGQFQHDHIFKPLGMTRTTAFRSVHYTDDNIATPYMILSNGKPSKIAPTELSAESMNGGSGGIRSSVNDMLKWCQSLLASFEGDHVANLVRQESPVFDRSTIANSRSAENGDYCAGWCYHRTPGKLGLISPNRELESPILGEKSPSLLLYGHQGDVPGYTSSLYIIPETRSAIVILSNGTGFSDATDWIAQDLIQTMYELQPAVNFVSVAQKGYNRYISHYDRDFKTPLEEHRELRTAMPPLRDLVGTYIMKKLDIVRLDVTIDPANPTRLQMIINEQQDQAWKLWHYHYDVFCQLPDGPDECLARGLDRTSWTSFLINFERDADEKVHQLRWQLDGVDVYFRRQ
ncbi:beta-lactamase/transpeptidase-like protein [Hypoxylon rubiginosum]|uniref:Beta-lactamase/transpeptidase-like protein n=1 Tax=Hypoxylon rubiginosum TaxID=110542 RepID=A0ACC0DCI0_9PEZI|nr:beta-lactamase/transpeptidase-like protein [Hypoxylon rubiginosum]